MNAKNIMMFLETNAVKVFVLFVILIVLMGFVVNAYADCLTPEQISAIEMMTEPFNYTLEQQLTIIGFYEGFCTSNLTLEINVTESYNDTMLLSNISLLQAQMNDRPTFLLVESYMNNTTSFIFNSYPVLMENITDQVGKWDTENADDMEDERQRYEEIFDEKLDKLKMMFIQNVTFQKWEQNMNQRMYTVENRDPYSQYLFLFICLVIVLVAAFSKIGPLRGMAQKIPGLNKIMPHEKQTQESIKNKTQRIRKMKRKIALSNLEPDEKRELMGKIDAAEIEDDKELDEEMEIAVGLKKKVKKKVKKK